jgi:hypothetical protein
MGGSTTVQVRRVCAVLASVLCLGAGRSAVLVPGQVALSYQHPQPHCPNEKTFRDRTADMYDFRDPFVPAGTAASATVSVVIEDIGVQKPAYIARIRVLNADGSARGGSEELHESCDALVYLAAHRVRLLMTTFPPPPAPPPPPPPAPAHPPPDPVEPCAIAGGIPMRVDLCNAFRAVLPRMDPTFGVMVGGALSLGFTADVGPGLFLAGEAHWRRKEEWGFHLALESRFFFPTKGGVATNGEVLDVTLLDFAVVPCARYKWVLGCALIDAGATFASGEALSGPEVENRGLRPLFMFGLGPRLAVDVPITEHVGVRAFADLRFSPLPPTGYRENGVVVTWGHPPVSGFLGLGASFK